MTGSPLLTSCVALCSVPYSTKRGITLSASHLEGLDEITLISCCHSTEWGDGKCGPPPSLPPAWQREPGSPQLSASVASTGVRANEGSVSPLTVVLLFQPEEPNRNVTLGMGEGQGGGR